MWIWETLKQLSDKRLLTGMESKIDLMVAMKWGVKPTKSPNLHQNMPYKQLKYICSWHEFTWKKYKKENAFPIRTVQYSNCSIVLNVTQERQKLAIPVF